MASWPFSGFVKTPEQMLSGTALVVAFGSVDEAIHQMGE